MIEQTFAEAWMRGVAANPAAPPEALLRLLDPAGRPAWTVLCKDRDLPAEVVEAVLRHPDSAVRRAFARNPFVDPAQRGRLVDDPLDLVRCDLASGPSPRPAHPKPLPDEVVEKLMLADDSDHDVMVVTNIEIVQQLIWSGQIRRGLQEEALSHPDPRRRVWAAQLWTVLSAEQRDVLRADPDPEVQQAVVREIRNEDPEAMAAILPDQDCHARTGLLRNRPVSPAVAEQCLASRRNLTSLACNPYTPADIVARLARDPDPRVREYVVSRPGLDLALVTELADDPEPIVRTRARMRQLAHDEPQRAAIDEMIEKTADDIGYCVRTAPLAVDWIEACAVSALPLLRRVAATCDDLPAELAEELAGDSDADVRHLLALNHPAAPGDLLIEAFIACPRHRGHLLTLPHMPRTGLARLADHDDPEVRALAAADPTRGRSLELDAALADPDPRVVRAAATNPGLAASRLAALLNDPETAEAAAANPRLSGRQIHDLLDRSLKPAPPCSPASTSVERTAHPSPDGARE